MQASKRGQNKATYVLRPFLLCPFHLELPEGILLAMASKSDTVFFRIEHWLSEFEFWIVQCESFARWFNVANACEG